MKKYMAIILAVVSLSGIAHADRTIWYVHPDSSLNTIQAGLDTCANNDIVLVGPGTYFENIVWPNTQGIHLISELGPEVTIIDGDSSGTVIRVDSTTGVDTTTVIRGFTIKNGYCDTVWVGAGVYCRYVSPTIRDNIIINNVSTLASIVCWGSRYGPRIIGNTISSNIGTGIASECDCTICDSNVITYNSASGIGGFIYYSVCNNTITHNNYGTMFRGAIYFENNDISYNVMDGFFVSPDPYVHVDGRQRYVGNTMSYNGRFGIGGIEAWFKNAIITHNGAGGVWGSYGVQLDSCTIAHNYGPGVIVDYEYNSYIHHCNIFDNASYGVLNHDSVLLNAEYNWWGDSTGPYHPDSNPVGQGDTVSNYVDFIPWIGQTWIAENPVPIEITTPNYLGPTIFRGPLQLPKGKMCKVFDIMGRIVLPEKMKPGVYFVEADGVMTQKVVKIR